VNGTKSGTAEIPSSYISAPRSFDKRINQISLLMQRNINRTNVLKRFTID
jgi:hypothetical protein